MSSILLVEDLFSGYGELPVLDSVRVEVGRGEIVSVVGANGAGKTTLLLTICGHLRAHAGRVSFDGLTIQMFRQPVRLAMRRAKLSFSSILFQVDNSAFLRTRKGNCLQSEEMSRAARCRASNMPARRCHEKAGTRPASRQRSDCNWWSGWGSNPRPSHCERDALPAELPPHVDCFAQ